MKCNITIPSIGESITEVEISQLIEQHTFVSAGEIVCEIESDKASLEIPAEQSGCVIFNRDIAVGSVVDIGTIIGSIDDTKAGKTLFEKNNNRVQPIASLTKILSALIILEENHINDIVTVPLEATKISGSKIDIYQYEKITVETLLKSVLIASANDSMVALAIHNAESEQKFVRKMNEKAKKMGLTSAKFYNSTGLDLYNPDTDEMYGNTMSANDLLTLTRIALKNDFLRETVKKDTFWGTSVNEEFAHEKTSTNQLLGTFVNSKGVKTGYTKLAGECLINLIQSEDNKEIITIILGSKDRFGETKNLVAWILDSFVWK